MGHRLRQQRTLLGLTREEFAELADISAGYYGQIEVGTSQMSIDTLIKLARSSRLSMEYILLGEERNGKPDLTTIDGLLADCSPREIRLAEKVLRPSSFTRATFPSMLNERYPQFKPKFTPQCGFFLKLW